MTSSNGFRVYPGVFPVFTDRADWTLDRVLRTRAAETPDKVCLEFPEESLELSYGQAVADAERVASGMLAAGGAKGDRVVVMAANSSRFIRTWWGASFAGLVEAPINTGYEGEFLRHQIAVAEPRFIVTDAGFAERFVAVKEHLGSLRRIWVIGGTDGSDEAVALLRSNGFDAWDWDELGRSALGPIDAPLPRELGAIFYTSGTTGPSKGVAMPHAQLHFFGQEVATFMRLTADDVYLTATPLFHGNATFMAIYPAVIAGGRAVIRSKFSASRWIDQIRSSGVTVTNLVGVMMDFVWKQPARPDDADTPLRAVYAAPTASTIAEPFRERFGLEAIVDAFGLTETSSLIMAPYGEPRPAGAAGLQVADWFELRLVDPETDEEVAVGEVGELIVRPLEPWTASAGYFNMPEKTVEAWRNLWFHTGDALRQDEQGWFYFVDRFKDALRRRGENISSYEVEQALLLNPAVAECAVVAVPADSDGGEDEVLAAIVLAPGSDAQAGELIDWCVGRIPAFATPRYLRVVTELPRTPSEKVQKSVIRDAGITADTWDRVAEDALTASGRR